MTNEKRSATFGRLAWLTFLWLVTVLTTISLGDKGLDKFTHAEGWQHWFVRWGYPAWFASVIGVAEAAGALLLLIPSLASYAAGLLIVIMAGAFYTVTTNETDLSAVDPVVFAVLLLIVLLGRWRSRLRPGGPSSGTAPQHPGEGH